MLQRASLSRRWRRPARRPRSCSSWGPAARRRRPRRPPRRQALCRRFPTTSAPRRRRRWRSNRRPRRRRLPPATPSPLCMRRAGARPMCTTTSVSARRGCLGLAVLGTASAGRPPEASYRLTRLAGSQAEGWGGWRTASGPQAPCRPAHMPSSASGVPRACLLQTARAGPPCPAPRCRMAPNSSQTRKC